MKLEDIVEPICLSESSKPITVRDLLCHLLYLAFKDDPKRKNKQYSDFHRKTAHDFLTLHNFKESELKNASPNVVR